MPSLYKNNHKVCSSSWPEAVEEELDTPHSSHSLSRDLKEVSLVCSLASGRFDRISLKWTRFFVREEGEDQEETHKVTPEDSEDPSLITGIISQASSLFLPETKQKASLIQSQASLVYLLNFFNFVSSSKSKLLQEK